MFDMAPEDMYKVTMQQINEHVQAAEVRRLVRFLRDGAYTDEPTLFQRTQERISDLRTVLVHGN
jgi:hypothetical protein